MSYAHTVVIYSQHKPRLISFLRDIKIKTKEREEKPLFLNSVFKESEKNYSKHHILKS